MEQSWICEILFGDLWTLYTLVCIILFSSVLLFEVLGILESLTGIIVAFVISLFLASITINSTMIPSLNMFTTVSGLFS